MRRKWPAATCPRRKQRLRKPAASACISALARCARPQLSRSLPTSPHSPGRPGCNRSWPPGTAPHGLGALRALRLTSCGGCPAPHTFRCAASATVRAAHHASVRPRQLSDCSELLGCSRSSPASGNFCGALELRQQLHPWRHPSEATWRRWCRSMRMCDSAIAYRSCWTQRFWGMCPRCPPAS